MPYSEADVLAAIREPRLVLELIGPRYSDPATATFPEQLADAIFNQGLYVGPAIPDALDRSLAAIHIAVDIAGKRVHEVDGKHPDGHPLRPLVWLATYLAQRDQPLRAGQIVTTGSYCGVIDVPVAAPIVVNFGGLGAVTVQFSALA